MIAAAANFVGGLTGFLFGIPRILQQTPDVSEALNESGTRHTINKKHYLVNTNLEQVSDWLTKILVGLGLTQLATIQHMLVDIANAVAGHLNNLHSAQPLIIATIIYYVLSGFIGAYMFTRGWLSNALIEADEDIEQGASTINHLVNLNLEIKELAPHEKNLLRTIITECEHGTPYRLPEDFQQHSEHHTILCTLEERHIIHPQDGGTWQAGTVVELTPIAQKVIETIKQDISE